MAQYAEDAKTNPQPWKLWQVEAGQGGWHNLGKHPAWDVKLVYRRKPETIKIGDIEIDAPYRGEMKSGDWYFYPNSLVNEYYLPGQWTCRSVDERMMQLGFVHLTKEAAIKHAKALIALTSKK